MVNSARFAIAGGIVVGVAFALSTALAVLGVAGFSPFADWLNPMYSPYGYSVTWTGVLVGALLGFAEGFVWLGALALVYNRLPVLGSRQVEARPPKGAIPHGA